MAFGVHSEVGKLRKVLVHRPGLEHTRLTPSNAEELLFDDVLWVKRAKEEHDAFAEVMRERGVEVFHAEQLLAEALVKPEAKEWACEHILNEREVGISGGAAGPRVGRRRPTPTLVAEFLIGGITKADVARDVGLEWESADPTSMLLPPLPNFLFQRDPSCWIYDGVTLNPMTKPARKPETMIMESDLPLPPDVRRRAVPDLAGRRRRGLGTRARRGRRRAADRQRRGDDRHGGAHHAAGGAVDRALAVPRRIGRSVLAVHLPKSRSYMHLDTVITMCDRDLVTLFPPVVAGARTWAIRPGRVGRRPRDRGAARARCPSTWRARWACGRCG